MNMREMLGEAGRSMSEDKRIGEIMGRMLDGGPRFEDRSPANQMFSIDAQIENLMKSYNMLVNAQEFGRAQEVADQIDQLQQQKIGIQAQNVPSNVDILSSVPSNILKQVNMQTLLGESGKTISNRDRQIAENMLEDISL